MWRSEKGVEQRYAKNDPYSPKFEPAIDSVTKSKIRVKRESRKYAETTIWPRFDNLYGSVDSVAADSRIRVSSDPVDWHIAVAAQNSLADQPRIRRTAESSWRKTKEDNQEPQKQSKTAPKRWDERPRFHDAHVHVHRETFRWGVDSA